MGDSDLLEAERIAHLGKLILDLKFGEIASDHSDCCGGGYMTQICPGVCPTG